MNNDKITTEDLFCNDVGCNCDKVHFNRIKKNLHEKYKCMKINIGDSVIHKGINKTVIAICTSSVILSNFTFASLLEMNKEDYTEEHKKCFSKELPDNGWIDLDEIELI